MVVTRGQEAAASRLYTALLEGEALPAFSAADISSSACGPLPGGLTPLHWAAAAGCHRAVQALWAAVPAAGNAPLDWPPPLQLLDQPAWLRQLKRERLSNAQLVALSPGMTPLAIACR